MPSLNADVGTLVAASNYHANAAGASPIPSSPVSERTIATRRRILARELPDEILAAMGCVRLPNTANTDTRLSPENPLSE